MKQMVTLYFFDKRTFSKDNTGAGALEPEEAGYPLHHLVRARQIGNPPF